MIYTLLRKLEMIDVWMKKGTRSKQKIIQALEAGTGKIETGEARLATSILHPSSYQSCSRETDTDKTVSSISLKHEMATKGNENDIMTGEGRCSTVKLKSIVYE